MKRPSASTSEAFVHCHASHTLPQHDSYGGAAEAGTNGHKLLADYFNGGLLSGAALDESLPGLRKKLAAMFVNVSSVTAEDAFVVDLESRTSQFLGRNIDRKYLAALGRAPRQYEVFCSLDLKGRSSSPWLRDFKFGITSSWWQIYIQSMAVLWLPHEEATQIDAGFVFVEAHDDKPIECWEDRKDIYLFDLDQYAKQMVKAFDMAERLDAELEQGLVADSIPTSEGRWCTYCGAFPHCPSKWKLAKSMLSAEELIGNVGMLTLEQCGSAWLKLAEVKKNIVKKLEDSLKDRMRAEGGFPTPDGKMLKVIQSTGRLGFDRDGAIELLQRLGASEDDIVSLAKRGESFDTVRKVNRK